MEFLAFPYPHVFDLQVPTAEYLGEYSKYIGDQTDANHHFPSNVNYYISLYVHHVRRKFNVQVFVAVSIRLLAFRSSKIHECYCLPSINLHAIPIHIMTTWKYNTMLTLCLLLTSNLPAFLSCGLNSA